MARRIQRKRLAKGKRRQRPISDDGGSNATVISGRISGEEEESVAGDTPLALQACACYCYMVKCANDAFYTGWTIDPERRIKMHNAGRGAAYTKMHGPVELVYIEKMNNRHDALLRELEIKKYTHQKKAELSASWLKSQTADPITEKEEE